MRQPPKNPFRLRRLGAPQPSDSPSEAWDRGGLRRAANSTVVAGVGSLVMLGLDAAIYIADSHEAYAANILGRFGGILVGLGLREWDKARAIARRLPEPVANVYATEAGPTPIEPLFEDARPETFGHGELPLVGPNRLPSLPE